MKRAKRRYFALQLETECLPRQKEFIDTVWGTIAKLYGEFGASKTNLCLISFDAEKKTAVIRTSLETANWLRTALASITRLNGKEAAVHVVAVSGTIKALQHRWVRLT